MKYKTKIDVFTFNFLNKCAIKDTVVFFYFMNNIINISVYQKYTHLATQASASRHTVCLARECLEAHGRVKGLSYLIIIVYSGQTDLFDLSSCKGHTKK